jgi:RNA-dependent RNA polymerase
LGALTGDVAVTRNPCLHPGDVRKLQAVSDINVVARLSHMKDCIVFSRRGPRPVTDMMAGGDLDGDRFFVTWEESIVQHIKEEPPAKYVEPDFGNQSPKKDPPKSPSKLSLSEQMVNFFLDYQEKNDLGLLTTAHEIKCASSKDGARDPEAMELARLANIAVDSAKTGQFSGNKTISFAKKPLYMSNGTEKHDYSIIGKLHGTHELLYL